MCVVRMLPSILLESSERSSEWQVMWSNLKLPEARSCRSSWFWVRSLDFEIKKLQRAKCSDLHLIPLVPSIY